MINSFINSLIRNQFLVTLAIIGILWLAFELKGILIIIFISYIIMAALSPFSDYLIKRKIPRIISVLVPYLLTIAILVLLIFPLVPFFISQIQLLFKSFPTYINQVAQALGVSIDISNVNRILQPNIENFGSNAISVTGKIFSGVFSFLTVLVISFYFMLEQDMLKRQFVALWPKRYKERILNTLSQVENKLGLWLRGQLVLSLAIGAATWIALMILGLPFSLPLALLAGILEIMPTIGPIISAVPAIIVALTISPSAAIFVVVAYILIQTLENNILVPKIMEKAVGLNPIVIIIGVLIGGKFFGFLGALLAVPFIAMLIIIIKSIRAFEE